MLKVQQLFECSSESKISTYYNFLSFRSYYGTRNLWYRRVTCIARFLQAANRNKYSHKMKTRKLREELCTRRRASVNIGRFREVRSSEGFFGDPVEIFEKIQGASCSSVTDASVAAFYKVLLSGDVIFIFRSRLTTDFGCFPQHTY